MKILLQYKLQILFFLIICLLFFIVRLPNLTAQPIFADEAIYVRWAQVMRAEQTLRFLPLSDGKTPLYMWALIPLFKFFEDPLYAGRFLSVLSGFATLVGVFLLALKVFNSKVALWSSLIYAVLPYSVLFNRMALVDSMLAAFTIWAIYLAIWLVKSPRFDLAMVLGYLLGGGILTKTPGMVNFVMVPVVLLSMSVKNLRSKFSLKLLLCLLIAEVIGLAIYNLLRLGPGFQMLSSRNQDYMFSFWEIAPHPLDPFIPHFFDIADWFPTLITYPILILLISGLFLSLLKKDRLAWVVFLWAIIPLLTLMALLKTFTARYLLFSIPPLLIFAGLGADYFNNQLNIRYFKKHFVSTLLLVLTIMSMTLHFNYLLIHDIEQAPLPDNERKGYLEDWTAGYHFPEIAQFLIEQKQKGSVVVGTEGYFGTLPDGLQIYMDKAGIPIIGSGATISAQLRNAAKDNQTFFVANKNRIVTEFRNVTLIKEFPKAKPRNPKDPHDAIVLYQVFPEDR